MDLHSLGHHENERLKNHFNHPMSTMKEQEVCFDLFLISSSIHNTVINFLFHFVYETSSLNCFLQREAASNMRFKRICLDLAGVGWKRKCDIIFALIQNVS